MRSYIRHPLVQTWLLLVSATGVSAWLGGSEHIPAAGISIAILTIAVLKCRFVIRHFMDVRFAPPWLKRSCDAWLVLNFAMISAFYWFVA